MEFLRVITYLAALFASLMLFSAFVLSKSAPQQAAGAAMAAAMIIIPYCVSATAHRAAILSALRKRDEGED